MNTKHGEPTRRRGGLSLHERQQRNRDEMRAAILDIAREIMREQGVAALSLGEIARRVGITTPALYTYFSSKMALYDALVQVGLRLFREAEEELWRTSEAGWERFQAWFELRVRQAHDHPDLYHLIFDDPVPGLERSTESMAEVSRLYNNGLRALEEAIEAGAVVPGIPPDQALDLLLSMRRGIVAEHMGKGRRLDPPDCFPRLIPQVLGILRSAWSPPNGGGETSKSFARERSGRHGDDCARVAPPLNRGHAAPARTDGSLGFGGRPRRLGATQGGSGTW